MARTPLYTEHPIKGYKLGFVAYASIPACRTLRVRGQCGLHNTLSQKYQGIKQKQWREKG